jgi:quercetin dioxygenase-like cupin family protein
MQSTSREKITVGALAVRFLVEADESNASVSVFECDIPADARMPAPHSHDAFEATIYGLRGVSTWMVDDETIEIGPGEAVCVPRGIVHGFATKAASTRSSSPSRAQASSAPPISAKSARSCPPPAEVRRIMRRSPT